MYWHTTHNSSVKFYRAQQLRWPYKCELVLEGCESMGCIVLLCDHVLYHFHRHWNNLRTDLQAWNVVIATVEMFWLSLVIYEYQLQRVNKQLYAFWYCSLYHYNISCTVTICTIPIVYVYPHSEPSSRFGYFWKQSPSLTSTCLSTSNPFHGVQEH